MRPLIVCSLALIYCAAPVSADERSSGVGHELQRRGASETPAKETPVKARKSTDDKPTDDKSVENRPAQAEVCVAPSGIDDAALGEGVAKAAREDVEQGGVEGLPERAKAAARRLTEAHPAQAGAIKAYYRYHACLGLKARELSDDTVKELLSGLDGVLEAATVPQQAAEAPVKAEEPAPAVEAALQDSSTKAPETRLAAPDEQKAIDMAMKPFDEGSQAQKQDTVAEAAPVAVRDAGPAPAPAEQSSPLALAQSGEVQPEAPAKSEPAPVTAPVAMETPPPPAPPSTPVSPQTPPDALDWMISQARAVEPLYALLIAALVVGISAALTLLLRSRSGGRPGHMLDQGDVLGDLRETTGAPKNNRTPPRDQA
jgi:hypothetical protein